MTTDNTSAPTLREVVEKMTPLEKAVTVAHLEAGMECNGAETLDAMLSDNMTYADVAEIAKRTGLTKKQVQGVIASLSSKGVLSVGNEKPNGQPGVDQVLTDWGVSIAFDLLAEGIEAKATIKPATKKAAPKAKAKASNVVALPTTKKVRALEDRVLVEPTSDLSNVRPIREGTKRHAMVQALLKGCTLDQLATATGWKRDVAGAAIYTDLKAAGLGVRRENGLLILMLPNGSNVVPLRPAAATADKAANR
jgi:hypothetical protein